MKKNLLILCGYTLVLLASECLYRVVFDIAALEGGRLAESFGWILLLLALFYFARHRLTRGLIFVFFVFATLANNIHYTVYQSWITGINYWLMFHEANEAGAAGATMLPQLWPHIVWAAAECAVFFSIGRWRNKTFAAADWLFVALIALIGIRSFSTTQEMGISPKPTYSRIKANYFSFGYFIGRILPYQWFDLSKIPVYSHAAPARVSDGLIRNIVLIMGESESAGHIGLFGYPRETSPFLTKLARTEQQAIVQPVYSSGLMTAVSLPQFFNAIPYPNGYNQINSGDTNLFRMAKAQGYQTHFYSAQAANEMSIMNLIGQKWIDDAVNPTNLAYSRHDNMPDDKLLPLFEKIDLSQGRHLIVLHQRGSHVPYGSLLEPQDHVFGNSRIIDKYDNTIYKTDRLIERVFNHLQQHAGQDWLLAYTSDHGQYVTDKVYNQGTIHPDSYTVPLMVYSPDQPVSRLAAQAFAGCSPAFHQQLSVLLAKLLGYGLDNPGCRKGFVTGNLITGDAGYLEIDNHRPQYIYPQ